MGKPDGSTDTDRAASAPDKRSLADTAAEFAAAAGASRDAAAADLADTQRNARSPLVSIASPDELKKIRTMQVVNFGATMLQLGCAIAVILMVRYDLYFAIYTYTSYYYYTPIWSACLLATAAYQGMCSYAYSLAAVSLFFSFIVCFIECLTMDCCGSGRVVAATFDGLAFAWWIAGAIVLAVRANEANEQGLPQANWRNAVVAMAFISAALFLVLLAANVVLMMRFGKAYKTMKEQQLVQMTAPPVDPRYGPYGTPTPNAGQQPLGPAAQQPPTGYPTQAQTVAPAGVNAGPNAV